MIARAIHANSPRAAKAFVPVDCASLPEQLLESELFGHEKGACAFTGAVRTKPGLMEVAHGGTLFLVWQWFGTFLPEARQAIDRIGEFISQRTK